MTEQHEHLVPYRTFLIVWGVLLVLTVITVAVSRFDLGALNIWVALAVATVKSTLVVAFFMHLKYEQPLFKLALVVAVAILAIFIGLTFFDVLYR